MSQPKLSFGLKLNPTKRPAVKPKPSAFGQDDDDEAPPPAASTSFLAPKPKISTATLSRTQKAKQAADIALDSSVYEYDEVYDNMKQGARLIELDKKKDANDRKPKYISRLLETAEVRKRDRTRAEDKMVQREREMEGEEFADRDAFVTPAYLAQQEELRKVEEDEVKKDAIKAKASGGISSFLKNHQEATAKAHDAAVAASLSKTPLAAPSTLLPARQTDAELAAEVSKATGRKIEVNDEGIIIDKRQLLSGGLNIIAKPQLGPANIGSGFAAPISARTAPTSNQASTSATTAPPGLSAAERGRQARERQSREVERQMMALDVKRKRDEEEALSVKVAKVVKRNDSTKIEELRKKAEERRLKKEQDAAAAAALEP